MGMWRDATDAAVDVAIKGLQTSPEHRKLPARQRALIEQETAERVRRQMLKVIPLPGKERLGVQMEQAR
jgi:hypothetical protein